MYLFRWKICKRTKVIFTEIKTKRSVENQFNSKRIHGNISIDFWLKKTILLTRSNSQLFFIKISPKFFFVKIFDDDEAELIVDIAEISSVNCGLYPFRNGKSIFKNLTLSPTLNFSSLYLVRGFFYRIERNSVFLTSLGDFPIDLMTQQFIVDTNCGSLWMNFSP